MYTKTPLTQTYNQIGHVILAIFLCSINLPRKALINVNNTKGNKAAANKICEISKIK